MLSNDAYIYLFKTITIQLIETYILYIFVVFTVPLDLKGENEKKSRKKKRKNQLNLRD